MALLTRFALAYAPALDRLPTVFVLQGILAANFSGKGHLINL